jgi:hypothetical protein
MNMWNWHYHIISNLFLYSDVRGKHSTRTVRRKKGINHELVSARRLKTLRRKRSWK